MNIVGLAKFLRLFPSTVRRHLGSDWKDIPREVIKQGKKIVYKFNKKDVWDYFKKKYD